MIASLIVLSTIIGLNYPYSDNKISFQLLEDNVILEMNTEDNNFYFEYVFALYIDSDLYHANNAHDFTINQPLEMYTSITFDLYSVQIQNNNLIVEYDLYFNSIVNSFTEIHSLEDVFYLYEDYVFEEDYVFSSIQFSVYNGFNSDFWYDQGFNSNEEGAFSYVKGVLMALTEVFKIEIIPNISLWSIILIPIVFGVIAFFLNLWR